MPPTHLWVICLVVVVVFVAFMGIFIDSGTKDDNTSNAVRLKLLAEGADSTVDIIAIHGLDGHWNATWTADNQKFWIKDFLPDVIPHARVFSYSYDSRARGSSRLSTQSIYEIGRDLVVDLAFARRQTNTSRRPIIFIAHSLGGIVVKSALSYSHNLNKDHLRDQKAVKLSTYGILFIGCPHQGGTNDTLAVILARMASIATSTNTELLQHLQRHSEFLQEQQDRFLSISGDFVIKFFYEMYPTQVPGIGEVHIVPQDSAIIPGTVDAEIITLAADHRNMVKFHSRNDKGFKDISRRLEKMTRDVLSWDPRHESTNIPYDDFDVPFRLFDRDDKFTGRMDILSQLGDVLNSSEGPRRRTVVLHGTGGAGKTAIAIEYAHMQRSAFSSVLWIDSSTQMEARRSFWKAAKRLVGHYAEYQKGVANYNEIAAKLHLDGLVDSNGLLSEDSQASDQIVDAVKEWLANERNHRWLLVFDNYDDFDSFRVQDFFPQSPHGSIIVTSRKRDFDKSWAGIEVDGLNMDEALQLLKGIANLSEERVTEEKEIVVKLLSELGCLPLAIRHAGSYIFTQNLPLGEFLDLYSRILMKLVARHQPGSPRGNRSDDIVFATWEISFAAIERDSPMTARLLQLLGFLARENVWDDLLRCGYYDLPQEGTVEESIDMLCAYSLIKCKSARSPYEGFSVHPLVHSWVHERSRSGLDVQRKLSKQALELVAGAADQAQTAGRNPDFERRIIPHLDAAFANIVEYLSTSPKSDNLPPLIHHSKINYSYQHRTPEERGGWNAWAWREVKNLRHYIPVGGFRSIEPDNEVWRLAYKLGSIYKNQRHYNRAETIYRWAFSETQAGPPKKRLTALEIVEIAEIASDLALSIHEQERYNEALGWYYWTDITRRTGLLNTHPPTMDALIDIAWAHFLAEQYEEAEKLLIFLTHPATIDAVIEITPSADRYQKPLLILHVGGESAKTKIAVRLNDVENKQKDYEKMAERHAHVYRRCARWRDPPILVIILEFSKLLEKPGHHERFLKWNERAVAECQGLMAEESSDIFGNTLRLATVYANLGQRTKAEELHVETRKTVFGQEHPDVLERVYNLLATYRKQNRWAEAEMLYAQVVETRGVVLGQEHLDTLNSMHNLAVIYCFQKRWAEAETLYVQVAETRRMVLGHEHPDTLNSRHSLAEIYYKTQRWTEAERLYAQVVETRRAVLGQEHPDTLASMHGLAGTYCLQERWAEAEELYAQAVETRKAVLGQEHPGTLASMQCLAATYRKQKRWAEVETLDAQVVEARKTVLGQEHPDTLNSMHNLAATYHEQKRPEAETLYAQVVETKKRVLGQKHPRTLDSMHNLAIIYCSQNRWVEAEALYAQVAEMRKTVLGQEHPGTLASTQNLAATYYNQKRWAEAEMVYAQVVETKKRVLGQEHPDTLANMHDLAGTYYLQNRWTEAETLHAQVAETRKTVLGQEHPDTLNSMHGLAATYRKQKRWAEAETLYAQVVEARKTVLGQEHPDTLSGMYSLAATYHEQKRWAEAEMLYAQVVETGKRVLGREHPDTLDSMHDLTAMYYFQNRWAEAEALNIQVVETRRTVLGQEHPDTLNSMNNLAEIYCKQKRLAEAETLYVQVVEARKTVLGQEHPDTLNSMHNLAGTYYEQKRAEAETLYVQVMEARKRILGQKHPDTLSSMYNLAMIYYFQNRWAEAETLYAQVVKTRKTVLGQEHPNTLASMHNLAVMYCYQKRWAEAETLYVQVVEARKAVLGQEHPDTLNSMRDLAATYHEQKRAEAETLYAQIVETKKRVLGQEHPDTLTSMHSLAMIYYSQNRWAEAEKLYAQVVKTRKTVLGREHPNTLASMKSLAATYRKQKRWAEAETLYAQVVETRKTALGQKHPESMNNLAATYFNKKWWWRT